MRNRMYGGVRGRKTKVGEKLLRFPPTRFFYDGYEEEIDNYSSFGYLICYIFIYYAAQNKMIQVLILSSLKNIRQFWEIELAWIP